MADRRMISGSVIGSDDFVELPVAAQALYFHLCANADDDGFVNGPRKLARMIGANASAIDALCAAGLVYHIDGVVVIRHWLQHNAIRKDRYTATVYQSIFAALTVVDDVYYMDSEVSKTCGEVSKTCGEVSKTCGEVSKTCGVGKVRLGKDRLGNIDYCSEQNYSEQPEANQQSTVVAELPLIDGTVHIVTEADADTYSGLYPAVDVIQQLRNMVGWLDSHPKRRKTSKGIKAFINSWLAGEQDKGRIAPPGGVSAKNDQRNAQYERHGEITPMGLESIKRLMSNSKKGDYDYDELSGQSDCHAVGAAGQAQTI